MHCQPGSGRSLWCTADSSFSLFSTLIQISKLERPKFTKALIWVKSKSQLEQSSVFNLHSSSCSSLCQSLQQPPVVLVESLGSSQVQTSAFYCSLTWLRPLPLPSAHHHALHWLPLAHYLWRNPSAPLGECNKTPDIQPADDYPEVHSFDSRTIGIPLRNAIHAILNSICKRSDVRFFLFRDSEWTKTLNKLSHTNHCPMTCSP